MAKMTKNDAVEQLSVALRDWKTGRRTPHNPALVINNDEIMFRSEIDADEVLMSLEARVPEDLYMSGDEGDDPDEYESVAEMLIDEFIREKKIDTLQADCAERIEALGRGAQTMAAEVIGCDRRQLSGWLGGKNAMSEDRIRALVEWLGGRYVSAHADWTE